MRDCLPIAYENNTNPSHQGLCRVCFTGCRQTGGYGQPVGNLHPGRGAYSTGRRIACGSSYAKQQPFGSIWSAHAGFNRARYWLILLWGELAQSHALVYLRVALTATGLG